jgi:uncharacterized membrane protein
LCGPRTASSLPSPPDEARVAAIVIAGIGAVLDLISLIKGSYPSVVGLALNLVIIYLLNQAEAKRAFELSAR